MIPNTSNQKKVDALQSLYEAITVASICSINNLLSCRPHKGRWDSCSCPNDLESIGRTSHQPRIFVQMKAWIKRKLSGGLLAL